MKDQLEYIATTLKTSREAKGLSQRALSIRTGIPQSHISNIENGHVDLKASSLIELARHLELEMMLVPRQTITMVRALSQQTPNEAAEPLCQADLDED